MQFRTRIRGNTSFCSALSHSLILNSHSLAVLASACANKGSFNVEDENGTNRTVTLFSPTTLKKMTGMYEGYEVDKVIGTVMPFTHGGLGSFTSKGQPTCYGWQGAGGVTVRFFPDLNLSFAYPKCSPLFFLYPTCRQKRIDYFSICDQ